VALADDDRVRRCGIGLIGLGSTPERAGPAESALLGGELDLEEVGRLAVADLEHVPSDLHGSAAYRMKVGAVLVQRALASALEEALSG
jgi:carbon-monoxide dehydrogenase medium subunit